MFFNRATSASASFGSITASQLHEVKSLKCRANRILEKKEGICEIFFSSFSFSFRNSHAGILINVHSFVSLSLGIIHLNK